MASTASFRVFAFIFIGGVAPLCLTQCKTTTKSYKDVKYDPAKLKTPAGHGMEKKDYPFDESGAYRKDWVKNKSSGRDSSASPRAASTSVASTETASESTGGRNSYPTYAEASKARSETSIGPSSSSTSGSQTSEIIGSSSVSEPETPAPAQPSYHKVKSGDTLFSLAGRYSTSVPELKRVNGLKSDNIRVGQSLRLP